MSHTYMDTYTLETLLRRHSSVWAYERYVCDVFHFLLSFFCLLCLVLFLFNQLTLTALCTIAVGMSVSNNNSEKQNPRGTSDLRNFQKWQLDKCRQMGRCAKLRNVPNGLSCVSLPCHFQLCVKCQTSSTVWVDTGRGRDCLILGLASLLVALFKWLFFKLKLICQTHQLYVPNDPELTHPQCEPRPGPWPWPLPGVCERRPKRFRVRKCIGRAATCAITWHKPKVIPNWKKPAEL